MMLFRAISSFACYAVVTFLITVGCSNDESNPFTPISIPAETSVGVVDSYSAGEVTTPSGYAIEVTKGSVPETAGNSAAEVTFSIETKIDPPKPLPPGIERIGNFVKFGPDGFIFRWPVRVSFPYPADMEPVGLGVMFYSLTDEKWVAVPQGLIDIDNNKIHADVLELGFFALVQFSGRTKIGAATTLGGFEFVGSPAYHYSLTVNVVNFQYQQQAEWYSKLRGRMTSSGSNPTGGPMQPTHIVLPQGSYEIYITRTIPGTSSSMPIIETYSVPATGTIERPLKHNESGVVDWTPLQMPSGGAWVNDRPTIWLTPSEPLGTSGFQATLTWDNSTFSATDLDLHLYGPNSLHVYWDNTVAANGSFELDVDWREDPLGHATENIFSTGTAAKGHYILKVVHYEGARKAYSVRVIRNGTSKTTTGILDTDMEHTILEFDVL